MTTTITESTGTATPRQGRMLVQIITPGVGSSGVYPAPVVEAAAAARVFPAGTHMYADHPSLSEAQDRPERSIKDLAGVLTTDAYWDGTALVAEAKTYEPWTTVLAQMHDSIGVSIRASARVEESDDQGRPVIAELVEGISVDFVTHAGRGGKVLQVLESARQVQETLPGGLVASDLEQRLDAAVGDDSWVQDFTDEWIVYRTYMDGDGHLVQQSYSTDADGRVTLTGTPQRVSRRVTYDAQDLPSTSAGIAERKEPTMAQIQIDEAEHKRLNEAADKLAATEAERESAVKRAEEAEAKLVAANEAADAAHVDRIIAAAGADFTALEAKGLRVDMPVSEGRLDVTAFEKTVAEAAAEKRAAAGEGRPTGVGPVTESTDMTEADADAALGIEKGA
ncbi:hypothetical protein NLU66_16565 [Brachybacterium sp. NBEC-018]|uniref:hypothetical protein n=1 Tax=Brachybacterium sp. NBEC-018 TaxID=2996004 RepID=UPI002174ED5C|nr:hypothetical protein [Brachybacterium sp. NBEC-018]UVY83801.1 hypothetical protein NLU66_16565 [Brachybacterium sp. NBEC-018]